MFAGIHTTFAILLLGTLVLNQGAFHLFYYNC
jgi:hypothetical protein